MVSVDVKHHPLKKKIFFENVQKERFVTLCLCACVCQVKITAFSAAQFREQASRTKFHITFSEVFFFTCEKLSLELLSALLLTVMAGEFDMSFIIPADMWLQNQTSDWISSMQEWSDWCWKRSSTSSVQYRRLPVPVLAGPCLLFWFSETEDELHSVSLLFVLTEVVWAVLQIHSHTFFSLGCLSTWILTSLCLTSTTSVSSWSQTQKMLVRCLIMLLLLYVHWLLVCGLFQETRLFESWMCQFS